MESALRQQTQDNRSAQSEQESHLQDRGSAQRQRKQDKSSAEGQQNPPPSDEVSAQGQREPPPQDTEHAKSHDPILKSREILKQQHVADWLFQNQHQAKHKGPLSSRVHWEEKASSNNVKRSPTKRSVYLSNTFVQFPDTMVGAESMVKVRLCNRDVTGHHFSVIKPSRPFRVSHINFEIG